MSLAREGHCDAEAVPAYVEREFRRYLRANRVIERVRTIDEDVLLFSSGHILRVLNARWLGLDPSAGQYFLLSTASLSALGYEHDRSEPVIRLWDDTRHLAASSSRGGA